MADIKTKRVNIFIDQSAASAAYEKLIAQQAKYTKSIADGTAAGKNMVTQMKRLDEVNGQIKKVQDQMDKGLKPSLQQQTTLVTQLRNELKRLSESDPQFSVKLENFKKQNAELQRMQANVGNVTKTSEGLSASIGNMVTKLGAFAAGTFAFDKILGFLKSSIAEADQAQEAVDGLRLSLNNAGRSDLLTPLLDQADKFAEKFKALDNDDITKVFTKLVDYGKLSAKQMTDLTEVIINFAAKQKVSLPEATDTITRALEGNAKGLKTYGINLKDASTVSERFGIIMQQLGTKVQGAEAVFESSNQGFFAKIKQGFRDAEEAVGKFLYSLTGIEKQSFQNAVTAKREADSSQVLVDRYVELSKKVNKTTEDKAELDRITTSLAATFGNSVVEIDKETGSLKLNVDATQDLIKQKLLLANDKAAELASKYNAALEGQKSSTNDLTIAQQVLNSKVKDYGLSIDDIQKKLQHESLEALSQHEQEVYKVYLSYRNASISLKDYSKQVTDLSGQLKELGFSGSDVDKLFHPGSANTVVGNGDDDEAAAAAKKAGEDAKKAAEDAAKKLADLKKQAKEFLKQLDDDDFLARIPNDLQQIATAAKKYFTDIQKLTDDFNQHLISPEEFKTGMAQVETIYKDKIHDLSKDPENKVKVEVVPELPEDPAVTKNQMDSFLKSIGFKTPEELKTERQKVADLVLPGLDIVSQALDALGQQQERLNQRKLEMIDKTNDAEKKRYAQLLGSKQISNQAYLNKISELDKKAEAEKEAVEKQGFQRNKRLQIAQTIMNGAAGAIRLWVDPGFPDAIPLAIALGAQTAAQVGIIAAQKFAAGGKVLSGEKIKGSQNVPTQSNGDNMLAYVRTGEVILNERQQAALGGPGVFASIGVPGFEPAYKNRPYMSIDTAGITNTYTRLRYAGGGLVGSPNNVAGADNTNLENIMQRILIQMQNPIPAIVNKVDIQLKQITDANDQLTRIKQNAILQ
jgi:DNA-directed RNA polymerase subunit F